MAVLMMEGNHIIIFAFIISSSIISLAQQAFAKCSLFPVVVPVDIGGEKFIVVNQCRGRDGWQSGNKQCVNTTSEALDSVFFYDGVNKEIQTQVYNHTNCSMDYVCDHDEKVPYKRPGVCYYHEIWNVKNCTCEIRYKNCHHPDAKKSTNEISTSSVGVDVFIIALVGQFVAMVTTVYVIRRCRKNWEYSTIESEKEIIRFDKKASYRSLGKQSENQ